MSFFFHNLYILKIEEIEDQNNLFYWELKSNHLFLQEDFKKEVASNYYCNVYTFLRGLWLTILLGQMAIYVLFLLRECFFCVGCLISY